MNLNEMGKMGDINVPLVPIKKLFVRGRESSFFVPLKFALDFVSSTLFTMQKPDAFSESPHPIYQPMKPDARDYPPGSLEQPPALGDQKQQMQYVTDGDIKKSISTPKGFSWTRLSKRAKILAVAILCVVIFVAAFVPAYITTHKNSTSAVATPPVNSTASNATSILLPKDNTTYRITIYGGRNGCNQFLSVGDCSLGNLVDMYSGDDGKILSCSVHY